MQEEKSSGNASFTRFYASIAENRQPRGNNIVKPMPKKLPAFSNFQTTNTFARSQGEKLFKCQWNNWVPSGNRLDAK
jgi:hypothetical protein